MGTIDASAIALAEHLHLPASPPSTAVTSASRDPGTLLHSNYTRSRAKRRPTMIVGRVGFEPTT
jgi:hypothetical protein